MFSQKSSLLNNFFVKNSYTECHKNPTHGLVTDNRSCMDGCHLISCSLLCTELLVCTQIKKIAFYHFCRPTWKIDNYHVLPPFSHISDKFNASLILSLSCLYLPLPMIPSWMMDRGFHLHLTWHIFLAMWINYTKLTDATILEDQAALWETE
jgi:hypothetical protein